MFHTLQRTILAFHIQLQSAGLLLSGIKACRIEECHVITLFAVYLSGEASVVSALFSRQDIEALRICEVVCKDFVTYFPF